MTRKNRRNLAAAFLSVTVCALAIGVADRAAAEDSLQRVSFVADRKAFRAGDMLTVLLVESTAASSTARTRTDKEDAVAISASKEGGFDYGLRGGVRNDFDGGGEISRTGQLLGKLTVVVDGVDANGNLTVKGEQTITINNEQQHIAIRGLVRPSDISPDNSVPSWRVAAAQIEFKGKGILARKQSPGLMAKLFDLFGIN